MSAQGQMILTCSPYHRPAGWTKLNWIFTAQKTTNTNNILKGMFQAVLLGRELSKEPTISIVNKLLINLL